MIDALEGAGRALYGHDWRATLCADMGWSRRFLDRIMCGQNEGQEMVAGGLRKVLASRLIMLREIMAENRVEDRRAKLLGRAYDLGALDAALTRIGDAEAISERGEAISA